MPKTQNRHQRRYNRLQAENDFNRVMKEYITIKYGPIVEEFCVFYDMLRDKYPQRNVYKNTKDFRLWVKGEITKYIEANNSNNDYAGENNEGNNDYAGENNEGNNDYAGENNEGNNDYAGENNEGNNDYAGENNEGNNDYAGENNEGNNVAADAIQQADREIRNILNDIENGDLPLSYSDDEGIKLDLYEELRGVSEDFNFDQEVDDNVFW